MWGHPNEMFEQSLVSVAQWAAAAKLDDKDAVTKEDARAELVKLKSHLEDTERMLRSLSPEVDLLLGASAAPLNCADNIATLLVQIQSAEVKLERDFNGASISERERRIALELCYKVVGAFEEYGHPVSATAVADLAKESPAVAALCAVGNAANLVRSPVTWRDLLAETLTNRSAK